MSSTTIQNPLQSKPTKAVIKTNKAGRMILEKEHVPHAGLGACTKCSCTKFVPSTNYKPSSIENHQPNPCGNCGHDVRMHGA